MGAKDTMKTFFMVMNEAMAPTSGYGPKIVSTPMGPFTWDDNLQVWVNKNNGMHMNSVSFQDMYIGDYDTLEGGLDYIEVPDPYRITTLSFFPTAQSFDIAGASGDVPVTPTFTISENSYPVAFKWQLLTGTAPGIVVKYQKNSGTVTPWSVNTSTGATTFSSGDTLKMSINVNACVSPATLTINLVNVTDKNRVCSNTLTVNVTNNV